MHALSLKITNVCLALTFLTPSLTYDIPAWTASTVGVPTRHVQLSLSQRQLFSSFLFLFSRLQQKFHHAKTATFMPTFSLSFHSKYQVQWAPAFNKWCRPSLFHSFCLIQAAISFESLLADPPVPTLNATIQKAARVIRETNHINQIQGHSGGSSFLITENETLKLMQTP